MVGSALTNGWAGSPQLLMWTSRVYVEVDSDCGHVIAVYFERGINMGTGIRLNM